MYTFSMFWYVWLVFVVFILHFFYYCLSIFCLVDRLVYVGYSVVCMVRSGGFSVLLTPFLLALLEVWVNYL